MGSEPGTSEGKIRVDEHYPSEADDGPPIDIKKIDSIRSNVKFDQCYEISKHIGDGKFGKVFHVKDKATGLEYAAKFIKIRKEADKADVEREVSILTNLRHPRIAQIYDAFYTTTNEVVLIMEIVRGGELFDRVADENYVLTEQAVAMIICQLCEAISYIHQQNIIHLDIKPENIMCVTQTGNRIKLIDFGLARYYDGTQELKYMAGTPEFAAPEVIKYENLDYHTDMWSVGVIAYILLSGYSPFLGDNLGETYCNVEKGVWEFTEEFDTVTPAAKDFILKLLIYDPRKRMLPADCLAHPWISQHRHKAMVDANLEKPGEGPKIDNRQMRGYNAKRKFRRMVIYVKFLIEMNRLRSSLKNRKSETGQKFFDPLLKMAEEKERKVAAVANALASRPPQSSKPALGTLVEATLDKKRISLPNPEPNLEKILSSKSPDSKVKEDKPDVKIITKTVVDPVTGEVKVVKKKSIKKTVVDGEKKTTVKRKEKAEGESLSEKADATSAEETPKKKKISVTNGSPPSVPSSESSVETPKKKKSVTSSESAPSGSETSQKKKSVVLDAITIPEATETSKKKKSLLSSETTADSIVSLETTKKKSVVLDAITVAESIETPKKKKSLISTDSSATKTPAEAETPKKKKSVVLPENPPVTVELKPQSFLDLLKKRKSLPAQLPEIPVDEKKEKKKSLAAPEAISTSTTTKKKSLVTVELPPISTTTEKEKTSSSETLKKKSIVTVELPSVEKKVLETKVKLTNGETLKKKNSLLSGTSNEVIPLAGAKSTDNLTLPRVEKKAQKSESSDSTKENRDQAEKKPVRQGALKKKEKLDDTVLNVSTARKSLDTSLIHTEKSNGDSTEKILVKKKLSLKSSGEKEKIDETKLEAKKEEKKGESLIKARLSRLNTDAPPPSVNIMSVSQKTTLEEKKPSMMISMTPEKTTTTTTSTTTSVRKKSSTTEKKLHLTADGKTVEQVEKTNSTQDKVKVSQITTKKEESPELEAPVTSIKKKVVKQNTLKAQSEKQRKEEEKTDDGSLVQVSKILNDKTLNQVAVNEKTTLPSGAIKKAALSTSSEVTRKIEGKAEIELTPKRLSLKKVDLTLTENAKTTLGADINGNKTLLQKAQKTEVKITPCTPNKEELITLVPVKDANETPKKRSSILTVPKLTSRDNSEERKTVRFAGDVKEAATNLTKLPSIGLQKLNSESCLHKKVQSSLKAEEKMSQDDGELKRKRDRLLLAAKSEEVYVPKDDFSFDSLKEKLLRRVSANDVDSQVDPRKDCISVAKTHSVRDRLRMFENKK